MINREALRVLTLHWVHLSSITPGKHVQIPVILSHMSFKEPSLLQLQAERIWRGREIERERGGGGGGGREGGREGEGKKERRREDIKQEVIKDRCYY